MSTPQFSARGGKPLMFASFQRRPGSWLFTWALTLFCIVACLSPAPAQFPPGGRQGPGGPRQPLGPRGPGAPNSPGFPGRPAAPPGIPNPPSLPGLQPPEGPEFITVWSCSNCGYELGRGAVQPTVDKCPNCGVHFINGTAPRARPMQPPHQTER